MAVYFMTEKVPLQTLAQGTLSTLLLCSDRERYQTIFPFCDPLGRTPPQFLDLELRLRTAAASNLRWKNRSPRRGTSSVVSLSFQNNPLYPFRIRITDKPLCQYFNFFIDRRCYDSASYLRNLRHTTDTIITLMPKTDTDLHPASGADPYAILFMRDSSTTLDDVHITTLQHPANLPFALAVISAANNANDRDTQYFSITSTVGEIFAAIQEQELKTRLGGALYGVHTEHAAGRQVPDAVARDRGHSAAAPQFAAARPFDRIIPADQDLSQQPSMIAPPPENSIDILLVAAKDHSTEFAAKSMRMRPPPHVQPHKAILVHFTNLTSDAVSVNPNTRIDELLGATLSDPTLGAPKGFQRALQDISLVPHRLNYVKITAQSPPIMPASPMFAPAQPAITREHELESLRQQMAERKRQDNAQALAAQQRTEAEAERLQLAQAKSAKMRLARMRTPSVVIHVSNDTHQEEMPVPMNKPLQKIVQRFKKKFGILNQLQLVFTQHLQAGRHPSEFLDLSQTPFTLGWTQGATYDLWAMPVTAPESHSTRVVTILNKNGQPDKVTLLPQQTLCHLALLWVWFMGQKHVSVDHDNVLFLNADLTYLPLQLTGDMVHATFKQMHTFWENKEKTKVTPTEWFTSSRDTWAHGNTQDNPIRVQLRILQSPPSYTRPAPPRKTLRV